MRYSSKMALHKTRANDQAVDPGTIREQPLTFLLDFDGLILDTESCALKSWSEEYAHYGKTLSLDQWRSDLGLESARESRYRRLAEAVGAGFDLAASQERRLARHLELIAELDAQPGVRSFLRDVRTARHPIAVVSSSPHAWVDRHLARLGLLESFDAVCCGDEVRRTKPAPDVYELALNRLRTPRQRAVAFEDAERGVAAATSASLPCVAVPNAVTAPHDFSAARLVAKTFDDPAVRQLIGRVGLPSEW
ncbi:MAG: hypothetical protein QOG10_3106 [Kribbellaceae bacterium]|nr:hypothetical protein [Kribbellaceae bacterium]